MITISEDDFTGGVFISLPVNMQVQNFGLAWILEERVLVPKNSFSKIVTCVSDWNA
jgi:hypothetical protein